LPPKLSDLFLVYRTPWRTWVLTKDTNDVEEEGKREKGKKGKTAGFAADEMKSCVFL
jgi:hypothetical protein